MSLTFVECLSAPRHVFILLFLFLSSNRVVLIFELCLNRVVEFGVLQFNRRESEYMSQFFLSLYFVLVDFCCVFFTP